MAAHSSAKHFVWQALISKLQTISERFVWMHAKTKKLKHRDSDASDFAVF